MILTNVKSVPGKRIVGHYGMVYGSTVRAKQADKDILAGCKNFLGREIKGFTERYRTRNGSLQK